MLPSTNAHAHAEAIYTVKGSNSCLGGAKVATLVPFCSWHLSASQQSTQSLALCLRRL